MISKTQRSASVWHHDILHEHLDLVFWICAAWEDFGMCCFCVSASIFGALQSSGLSQLSISFRCYIVEGNWMCVVMLAWNREAASSHQVLAASWWKPLFSLESSTLFMFVIMQSQSKDGFYSWRKRSESSHQNKLKWKCFMAPTDKKTRTESFIVSVCKRDFRE